MNNKYVFRKILCGLTSLLFLLFFGCNKKNVEYSATEIYDKAVEYTVEIKAESDGIGTSYGTGVIISNKGEIITNAHVVTYSKSNLTEAFTNFYIRFAYETKYRSVSLQKYDLELDLALLEIDDLNGLNLKNAKLGDSSKINFGEKVYAIGNASNYGIGIFQGIVSVPLVNIDLEGTVRSVIQCDLTIASGNSGGALVNTRNQLIGITTFRVKDNSGKIVYGIVYCIPINNVKDFIK